MMVLRRSATMSSDDTGAYWNFTLPSDWPAIGILNGEVGSNCQVVGSGCELGPIRYSSFEAFEPSSEMDVAPDTRTTPPVSAFGPYCGVPMESVPSVGDAFVTSVMV